MARSSHSTWVSSRCPSGHLRANFRWPLGIGFALQIEYTLMRKVKVIHNRKLYQCLLWEEMVVRLHTVLGNCKIQEMCDPCPVNHSVATVQLGSAWLGFADFGLCAAHGIEPSHQGTGWLVPTPAGLWLSHGSVNYPCLEVNSFLFTSHQP